MKKLIASVFAFGVLVSAASANAQILATGRVKVGDTAEDCDRGADAVYLWQQGTPTRRLAVCPNTQESLQTIRSAVESRLKYLSRKYPNGIVKTCNNPIQEECYYWSSTSDLESD